MVVVIQTVLTLLLSSMVAYGFAKYKFKGQNALFMCVLMVMMVPLEILMLPMYTQVNAMGLRNSYAGVILPFLVSMSAVFFFRQFLSGIPYEMIEAARVDGCTEYGTFFRIIMPTMIPAYASMTVLTGMGAWNALLWPMLVISDMKKYTIPIGLNTLWSPYGNNYDLMITGSCFAILPLLLIYREPDMSTTIITALVFCVIIFAAGLSFRIIFSILAVLVPSAAIFLSIVIQPNQTLIKDYQRNRIMAWLRPSEFTENAAQQQNSIIAIGSGQLYGKGLNNNAVYSVKNGNFISEPQTDFIFAVAGEELGFIGCVAIVLLEILIAVMCIRIGLRAKQKAGSLICCGMGTLVLFQSFLNVGVTTGLLPNTGITLPFVSYGVTSLISFCMGIGICLNVGLQPRRYPA